MHTPGEHKTVQARILEYADVTRLRSRVSVRQVGCTVVSREESEGRRGFDLDVRQLPTATKSRALLHELMTANTRDHHFELQMQDA